MNVECINTDTLDILAKMIEKAMVNRAERIIGEFKKQKETCVKAERVSFCPHCLEDHGYDDKNICEGCGSRIPDGVIELGQAYSEILNERNDYKKTLGEAQKHIVSLDKELSTYRPNSIRSKKKGGEHGEVQ